jgi:YVTN family beta-propeller protein
MHRSLRRVVAGATLAVFGAGASVASAGSLRPSGVGGPNGGPGFLPTGQYLTATAAPGSSYQRLATGLRADGNADSDSAMSSALSPDGKTLLVLTSGFNATLNYETGPPILLPALDPKTGLPGNQKTNPNPYPPLVDGAFESFGNVNPGGQREYVFVYDVSTGTAKAIDKIPINDTFDGLAWDPSGARFYVSGGVDDRVLVYKEKPPGTYGPKYIPDAPVVVLGHNSADKLPIPLYNGGELKNTIAGKAAPALVTGAVLAGFDVSKDGKTMVAANFENASATVINLPQRTLHKEIHFAVPGQLLAQGEFPFWVAVKSDQATGSFSKAYVTSERDSQVMVVTKDALVKVIPVPSGPNKAVLDGDQGFLYVACGNDDSVAVIDTATDKLVRTIGLSRPGDPYKGAVPNSIAVGPYGRTLYVTLGGENAIAVVDVASGRVMGRIPTGWLPTSVALTPDGKHLFVCNEKSNGGPNPDQTYYSHNTPYGTSLNKTYRNSYTWELEKSGLVSMPTPDTGALQYLTALVNANDGFDHSRGDDAMMAFLRKRITHVIYIVNENRTYDQMLGDLGNGGNGDPRLTYFNEPITPNLHALARDYVTLDNFYDSSETSGVGWNWAMQSHTNDFVEKTQPVQYGNSNGYGLTYDWQGIVANMNLGNPPTGGSSIFTTRITGVLDPSGSSTILPGYKDPSATEGADDLSPSATGGYIWETALRAGKTVRNYGWQIDLDYYGTAFGPPAVRYPFAKHQLQSQPSTPTIRALTDRYYRAFDQTYPDIYRIEEWKREYANFVAARNMPNLMVMTIPHDHTGSYGTALEGLGTPALELADHDYAIGQLVEAVSHGPYWGSTAIIMIEDDPQNGQDHVEAHRSIAHVISPWTRSHSVDHTTYTTVSAVRTVESLLGARPLSIYDANAAPMSTVFATTATLTPYTPTIPGSLCAPPVATDLVPACHSNALRTRRVADLHDRAWWQQKTAMMNFKKPDAVNFAAYNAILQYGMTGVGKLPSEATIAKAPKGDDD